MGAAIKDIILRIQAEKTFLGIQTNIGASDEDIRRFELVFGFNLPDDIKEFYKFTNGFDSDEDMFRIIPLDEIIDQKDGATTHQFSIAEYMIYADIWTVEIDPENQNGYGIYNSDHESEKLHLTNYLADFLCCFFDHGVFGEHGLYDWHNKLKTK